MTESPPDTPEHVLVRVWLPDRPGALGLVASRIGSVGGDIIGVDVLERERETGVAVDEFAVMLPTAGLLELMVREIEHVDGASVEEVQVVATFPDPRLDALESAASLCEAHDITELCASLVVNTREEFLANWSALVRDGDVLATAGTDLPAVAMLAALAAGTAASPLVAEGTTGPDDLAVAALPSHTTTLLVGRTGHPFRRRERLQLLALARIADRAWALLERPGEAGTADRLTDLRRSR